MKNDLEDAHRLSPAAVDAGLNVPDDSPFAEPSRFLYNRLNDRGIIPAPTPATIQQRLLEHQRYSESHCCSLEYRARSMRLIDSGNGWQSH